MAFSDYTSVAAVIKEFQIHYTEADFIVPHPFVIADYFRDDLHTVMREGVVDNSEYAICENLIYPVLKEVWKHYRSQFILWSHESLTYDQKLSGFPEYVLAKRSPLGKVVFDQPYFVIVEAKQDKFEAGWGQCLAAMVAAQRLNEPSQIVVFGLVSNGDRWQFGRLETDTFTKNITFYSIQALDQLFAAINYVFQQCESQLEAIIAV
ncbi:MAG: hypothetical protein F6K19_43705 [Cyanothece sp. SIO1E1]|nr:hypothetical protein [Cyanothece sp. SIO1E1]